MDERTPEETVEESRPAPEGDLADEGGPTQAGDERSEAASNERPTR